MSQQHIFYCYYFTFNLALQKWILKFNYHTRNTTCRTLRQIGTTGGRSVCFRGAQMPACAGPSDWPDTWIITITGLRGRFFPGTGHALFVHCATASALRLIVHLSGFWLEKPGMPGMCSTWKSLQVMPKCFFNQQPNRWNVQRLVPDPLAMGRPGSSHAGAPIVRPTTLTACLARLAQAFRTVLLQCSTPSQRCSVLSGVPTVLATSEASCLSAKDDLFEPLAWPLRPASLPWHNHDVRLASRVYVKHREHVLGSRNNQLFSIMIV